MALLQRVGRYFAEIIYFMPRASVEAWQLFGWRGLYMVLCTWVFRFVPISLGSTPWGRIGTWQEVANFVDNFALRELRSPLVESILRTGAQSWVVDLGVNVGITVRWWLSLSSNVSVIGLDMFQESIDFTTSRIRAHDLARWVPICGAVDAVTGQRQLNFDRALEGTTSLQGGSGRRSRIVTVKSLDDWLRDVLPDRITLLKIDIEGSGGTALEGGTQVLNRTENVVLEVHGQDELRLASKALVEHGFYVSHFYGRTIWWARPN